MGRSSQHRLTDLTGIDRERVDRLREAGFETVEHIAAATQEQLQSVDGIPSAVAARLLVETEAIEPSKQVREEVAAIQFETPQPDVTDENETGEPTPESVIDLTGVDRDLARNLREAGFERLEHVSAATPAQLQTVDGISWPFARRLATETQRVEVSPEIQKTVDDLGQDEDSLSVTKRDLRIASVLVLFGSVLLFQFGSEAAQSFALVVSFFTVIYLQFML